jgi:nickel/cobalt exporter
MRAEPITRRALKVLAFACLAILLSAFLGHGAQAQSNPFGAPGQTAAAPEQSGTSQTASSPSLLSGFWNWVQSTQANLHRQLAGAVRRFKTERGLSAGWLLISLSFLYGVIHAVGPGHGKAVISSYVVANERTARRGILLSFLASGVQALSAIVIIGVLAIAMNAAGIRIRETAASLETGSYALIALIGAWLLIGQLRPGGGHHHHAHDHGEGADCGHAHMPDPGELEGDWDLRRMAAIVFAVGVRPCSGALIVLVFALAQGIFWAGAAATFAMSLGTAITVSALAVLAVGSKQLALRFADGDSRWTEWIYRGSAIGGSALVLLLGVVLFIGSLGPTRPF